MEVLYDDHIAFSIQVDLAKFKKAESQITETFYVDS